VGIFHQGALQDVVELSKGVERLSCFERGQEPCALLCRLMWDSGFGHELFNLHTPYAPTTNPKPET